MEINSVKNKFKDQSSAPELETFSRAKIKEVIDFHSSIPVYKKPLCILSIILLNIWN